jgi:signal transduction histidine kinase
MIESPTQRRGIRVLNDLPAVKLPVVANAREIEQVFLNLFLNAVDAMPHGGRLRISAHATPAAPPDGNGQIEVTVADTGEGIPAELHERIFEPFFSTKPESHGTGLGLSVCQGLIRSHQGAIELQSEPGKGTRFIVKLPIAPSGSESEEVSNV